MINFFKLKFISNIYKSVLKYLFQIILIIILLKLLFFTEFDFKSFQIYETNSLYLIFIILTLINVFSFLNYYILLKSFCKEKFNSLDASKIYFEGGIVNFIYTGVGILYKYYKFKKVINIKFIDFVFVQSTFSIISIFSYLVLGIFYGFISIYFYSEKFFYVLILPILFSVLIFFLYRNTIKKYLVLFSKVNKFPFYYLSQIFSVVRKLITNLPSILIVFFVNIILSLPVGYVCYLLLQVFGMYLSYLDSLNLYISSLLLSNITMLNYLGAFEIALAFSGSYYELLPAQLILFGITWRIINMFSQIFILIIINMFKYINIYRS